MRRKPVVIELRGEDLSTVSDATRRAVLEANASGGIIQVWTWRNGEAVVFNQSSASCRWSWVVVIRRGRGAPQLVPGSSIAEALESLGIPYRIKSGRRRPTPADPSTSEGRRTLRRKALKRAARRKGNQWRTLRAKFMAAPIATA